MQRFILRFVLAFSLIFFSFTSNAVPPSGSVNHHYLYAVNIKDHQRYISVCGLYQDGVAKKCSLVDGSDHLHPRSIKIIPNTNYAYVTSDSQSNIYLCKIDDNNGQFITCNKPFKIWQLDQHGILGIAIDSGGTILYIVGYRQILNCPINQHDATLSECYNSHFMRGGGRITLTHNSPYLYYIDEDLGGVYSCWIGPDDSANDCKPTIWRSTGDIIRVPKDIVTDELGWHIYVPTSHGIVMSCAISGIIGVRNSFIDCKENDLNYRIKRDPNYLVRAPEFTSIAIASNISKKSQYVYIGDYNRDIMYLCNINESSRSGELTDCSGFHSPVFRRLQAIAYR